MVAVPGVMTRFFIGIKGRSIMRGIKDGRTSMKDEVHPDDVFPFRRGPALADEVLVKQEGAPGDGVDVAFVAVALIRRPPVVAGKERTVGGSCLHISPSITTSGSEMTSTLSFLTIV